MNIVNGFDIDTVKGSIAYLENQGFDVEEIVKEGMKRIAEIKEKIKSKQGLKVYGN